jgi:hypothetical protein
MDSGIGYSFLLSFEEKEGRFMERLSQLLTEIDARQTLIQAVLSGRRTQQHEYQKVSIQRLLLKNDWYYQFTYHYSQKVHHENIAGDQFVERFCQLFPGEFKQAVVYTNEADWQILSSKKRKVTILRKQPSKVMQAELRRKGKLLPKCSTSFARLIGF